MAIVHKRSLLLSGLLVFLAGILTGCGAGVFAKPPGTIISTSPTSVSLYPLTTEDLTGPCNFDLRLPATGGPVAATLVVFERGDTNLFYMDPSVQAEADSLHFAMLFAYECDSRTTGDLQADATAGPQRILSAALSELAVSSGHSELGSGNLILYGYSAAGVLTATMANLFPARLLGAVEYIAGDEYVDLDRVGISTEAASVPTLILDNALDTKSGTTRGQNYFLRGRSLAAPWAYGVQNATDHCCSLSTLPVVLPWLAALAGASPPPNKSSFSNPAYGTFTCTTNTTLDVFGQSNCAISSASLFPAVPAQTSYGWFPDQASGTAWRAWVLNPMTN